MQKIDIAYSTSEYSFHTLNTLVEDFSEFMDSLEIFASNKPWDRITVLHGFGDPGSG